MQLWGRATKPSTGWKLPTTQHGEWMVLLKVDPRFDSLRHDSRFQDLMRRMNFPELAANRTEA